MVLEPDPDGDSIYVREEYVLAHSSNIEIVISNKFEGSKHLAKLHFFKVITRS